MTDPDAHAIATILKEYLTPKLLTFPSGFFSSFAFTATGQNLTHPLMWGVLSNAVKELPKVHLVGIDVRLNTGACKFQPDIVGFDSDLNPMVFIDYESPNSSDARVPEKDVAAHFRFQTATERTTPYIIITTLPDRRTDSWELRYTARNYYNESFKGRVRDVVENPFRFWYSYYKEKLNAQPAGNVALLNIDDTKILGPWHPNSLNFESY